MDGIVVQCPACGLDIEHREGEMTCPRCGTKFRMGDQAC